MEPMKLNVKLHVCLVCDLQQADQNYISKINSLCKRLESADEIKKVMFFDLSPFRNNEKRYREVVLHGVHESNILLIMADQLSLDLGYLAAQAENRAIPLVVCTEKDFFPLSTDYKFLEYFIYSQLTNGFDGIYKRLLNKIYDQSFWPIKPIPGFC